MQNDFTILDFAILPFGLGGDILWNCRNTLPEIKEILSHAVFDPNNKVKKYIINQSIYFNKFFRLCKNRLWSRRKTRINDELWGWNFNFLTSTPRGCLISFFFFTQISAEFCADFRRRLITWVLTLRDSAFNSAKLSEKLPLYNLLDTPEHLTLNK
jgi:hypothetical protein